MNLSDFVFTKSGSGQTLQAKICFIHSLFLLMAQMKAAESNGKYK